MGKVPLVSLYKNVLFTPFVFVTKTNNVANLTTDISQVF